MNSFMLTLAMAGAKIVLPGLIQQHFPAVPQAVAAMSPDVKIKVNEAVQALRAAAEATPNDSDNLAIEALGVVVSALGFTQ